MECYKHFKVGSLPMGVRVGCNNREMESRREARRLQGLRHVLSFTAELSCAVINVFFFLLDKVYTCLVYH